MSVLMPYGATLTVEIALSASTGRYGIWGTGRWGSATWGPSETWVDVTQWVRSIETHAAFSRDVASWEAGTATVVLDNRDGRFSPANLSGPYVVGGITSIRPWRAIRIRASYGGAETLPIWRGYVKPWKERYSVAAVGEGDVELTLQCVDEFGSLARFDGYEQPGAGAGELSGLRIHRVLNNAGHSGARDVHPGEVTLQATTLAANCVTELKLTADSEGGSVFVGPDGAVLYRGRHDLIEADRSNTVQVTWGDDTGEMPYTDIEPDFDGDLLVNIAAFARVGSTVQVASRESSRALYGPAQATRTDLICETDAQALELARYAVLRYSEPEQRISRIEVTPLNPDPELTAQLWPLVLGSRHRDLVRIRRQPPGGYVISQDCHIAGIHHRIDPDDWRTSFDLFSAAAYEDVARWGRARWGQSKWFI